MSQADRQQTNQGKQSQRKERPSPLKIRRTKLRIVPGTEKNQNEAAPSVSTRLEVQPLLKGKNRVVIAFRGEQELHRDTFDTNSYSERKVFLKTISTKHPMPDSELDTLDAEMRQQADRNDALLLEASQADPDSQEPGRLTTKALLEFVDGVPLVWTPSGQGFIKVDSEGKPTTLLIRSKDFERWMKAQAYRSLGKLPTEIMLTEIQSLLEFKAEHHGTKSEVHIRCASAGDRLYVDTGRSDGTVYKINSKEVIRVEPTSVTFTRPNTFVSQPKPDLTGSIEPLFELLNINEDSSRILLAGLLVGMLHPGIPQPVLLIYGPQGAAKTTTTRFIKRLIDPTKPLTRGQPRDQKDLIIWAQRSRVLTFDNLSAMPPWLSDTFCQLSSGLGYSTRRLYTDDEEIVFGAVQSQSHRGELGLLKKSSLGVL